MNKLGAREMHNIDLETVLSVCMVDNENVFVYTI